MKIGKTKKPKKKQKFKKQTILSCLKGKTVDRAISELKYLSEKLGYGDCKIEISAALSSGPGYWKTYSSKIKCNILIPVEENENVN